MFVVSVICGENRSTREKPPPDASDWQILSHNVVSSTPRLSVIRTPNVSSDMHRLRR